MVWFEIRAKYPSMCCECRQPIMSGDNCYWLKDEHALMCVKCNDELYGRGVIGPSSNLNSPSGTMEVTKTTTREDDIKKAHQENMAANRELVQVLHKLCNEIHALFNPKEAKP